MQEGKEVTKEKASEAESKVKETAEVRVGLILSPCLTPLNDTHMEIVC